MQRFEICDFVCKKVCKRWLCARGGPSFYAKAEATLTQKRKSASLSLCYGTTPQQSGKSNRPKRLNYSALLESRLKVR
jgi:hypothetical protein